MQVAGSSRSQPRARGPASIASHLTAVAPLEQRVIACGHRLDPPTLFVGLLFAVGRTHFPAFSLGRLPKGSSRAHPVGTTRRLRPALAQRRPGRPALLASVAKLDSSLVGLTLLTTILTTIAPCSGWSATVRRCPVCRSSCADARR